MNVILRLEYELTTIPQSVALTITLRGHMFIKLFSNYLPVYLPTYFNLFVSIFIAMYILYARNHTHTHTHTHIYIYIYICLSQKIYLFIYLSIFLNDSTIMTINTTLPVLNLSLLFIWFQTDDMQRIPTKR